MNFSYPACHAPVINNQLLHVDSRNMGIVAIDVAHATKCKQV